MTYNVTTTRSSGTHYGDDTLALPVLRAVNLVLRRWRWVVILPMVAAVVVAILTLMSVRTYTANASFVPQISQTTQSQFAGIAQRFGFDLSSSGSNATSPTFFKALLDSDELLGDVAATEFVVPVNGGVRRLHLAPLLGVDEPTAERERYKTIDRLRDIASVDISTASGVVGIQVRAPSESLSVQIARRMIELVNQFNLKKRQEQAAAERAFMQDRLDVALRDMRAAEDNLQAFLERNRQYQGDPRLVFAYERARRDLDMKQGIYTTLAQNYEQAALNAIRDTPVITTVQSPEVRPVPDGRGLVIKSILAFLVTAVCVIAVLIAFGAIGSTRDTHPDDFRDFEDLKAGIWTDLSRPFKRVSSTAGR
jgi:hypothetical protein